MFAGVWRNGRMEGAGILTYPCGYKFHGQFDRNLPKGPGVFAFEDKWIQQGFYINMRDPAFDYVGVQELVEPVEDDVEDRSNPRGIVPIWRARTTLSYKQELLPPEPRDLPIKDSEDSLLDIIDYLQQQYKTEQYYGEEEEGGGGGGEEFHQ
ncbi:PREDICTED: uncharacterized protein LOC108569490 [Nicrophorus vespilloides]|uniref:Uncharacterized protein LOC108569490 n=1 Tax=Nicrophorus vespilloides TaxID=110193 RepID=A0ABM1NI99_NICVS|nr:PREDICTED: uncharacterized protein LOC108569490 [Nicrophorus vespilloides]